MKKDEDRYKKIEDRIATWVSRWLSRSA